MALSGALMQEVVKRLKHGMRVASFGYPDMIAPADIIAEALKDKSSELKFHSDSEAICKRHGLSYRVMPDAHSFFALLDCKLDVYDIVRERGCEILCDLNMSMFGHDPYDIILDVGTLEHCFNIGQAAMNMAGMLKAGGFIFHENPHSGWHNHGFYSIHPTFYNDFYTSNDFELLKCVLSTKDGQQIEVPLTARFNTQGERELNLVCVAKRKSIAPFKYPMQKKYKIQTLVKPAAPAAGVNRAKEISNV